MNLLTKFCLGAAICMGTWGALSRRVQAQDTAPRKHPDVEIFVNNHRSGATNGCTTGLGVKGKLTCGHPGHVSEVEWSYVRSTSEGDIYRITRRYPSDTATPSLETQEISFRGKTLVLWRDTYQKIILRHRPTASPAAPDAESKSEAAVNTKSES